MAIVNSYSSDEKPAEASSEDKLVITEKDSKQDKNESKVLDGEENRLDLSLRPSSFDEYIGQAKLKETLKISISAAKKRKDLASAGHVLLYGPPGLGKTTCAYLLANELGTEAKVFSAPALQRPKDIIGILMSLNEGDILFIDEIHRLNSVTEELLYPAMEDFQIDLSTGQGASSRVMRFDIKKFILVGATTKLGSLSAPLRDRFVHIHRMEHYKQHELSEIAIKSASLLNAKIDPEAAMALAVRSRGTPRIVNRLLRLVRDYAEHHEINLINSNTVTKALDLYNIDQRGLNSMDYKILEMIVKNHNGGPVGLDAIASSIGEDRMTIEDYYEPFLIQQGLLSRTARGRVVTEEAHKYLQSSAIQPE